MKREIMKLPTKIIIEGTDQEVAVTVKTEVVNSAETETRETDQDLMDQNLEVRAHLEELTHAKNST